MNSNSCLALALTGLKKHITSLFRAQKYNQKTSHNKNVLNYKYANGATHSWAFECDGVVRAPAQHGVSVGFSYARCGLWIPAHCITTFVCLAKKVQDALSSLFLCSFCFFLAVGKREMDGTQRLVVTMDFTDLFFFWQE